MSASIDLAAALARLRAAEEPPPPSVWKPIEISDAWGYRTVFYYDISQSPLPAIRDLVQDSGGRVLGRHVS